ncbi:peptidoglycan-binding protein [Streptomyces roseolus]|uniref:peptidoglycan-binding protein n=1 Tax=Streptomyces roseolus TaxID=67358 RepID=UPI00379071F5
MITAPVEHRVLKDSVILRGMVTSEQSVDVVPSVKGDVGGAPLVTRTPLGVGDPVKQGSVLLEVSGRPLFAFKGNLPAYRDIKPGMSGEDVTQLQVAMRSMGFSIGNDPSGTFAEGTKAALAAFYESIGYEAIKAQPDGGVSVKDAEDELVEAERRVQDLLDAPGAVDTPMEAEGVKGGTSVTSGAQARQLERAREDVTKARRTVRDALAVAGPMLPASEVVFLRSFPARVDSVIARVGAVVNGKALTVSAGALVVEGHLSVQQKSLIRPGQRVEILSEMTGMKGEGRVTTVADRISLPTGAGENAAGGGTVDGRQGFLLLVKPTTSLANSMAGQGVRLTVEAASTTEKVLAVPVSAISSGADGRTFVQTQGADGSRRRIPVTTGVTGDGYVQVTPEAEAVLGVKDRVIVGTGSRGER